jgi:hypothetical protein
MAMTTKLVPPAIGPTMHSQDMWTECLTCPRCGETGHAGLSQPEEGFSITVDSVPAGFDAVLSEFGVTFFCACGGEAVPR